MDDIFIHGPRRTFERHSDIESVVCLIEWTRTPFFCQARDKEYLDVEAVPRARELVFVLEVACA